MNRTFVLGAAILLAVLGFSLAGSQDEAIAGHCGGGLFSRCDGDGGSFGRRCQGGRERCHGGRDRCHGGLLARLHARRAAKCSGAPACEPACGAPACEPACGAPACEPACGAPADCGGCAPAPSCGAPAPSCGAVEPSCGAPAGCSDCAVAAPSCGVAVYGEVVEAEAESADVPHAPEGDAPAAM